MKRGFFNWMLAILSLGFGTLNLVAEDRVTLVVVTGIAGAEEYQSVFAEWSKKWRDAGEQAGARVLSVGEGEHEEADRDRLQSILAGEVQQPDGQLWLVFHGHGTFNGEKAKFNLRGPDLGANDLSEWLKDCKRPMALIGGFSASAPFINTLSGPNRVILSATKSGYEFNYSRFGGYVADAVGDLKADLDKDGQVSLLEAFLKGARDTEEFYALEGRLASEHALLDDTGDKRGTGPDWFRGVRVIKKPKEDVRPDGRRAHQFHLLRSEFEQHMPADLREKRDALEILVLQLRDRKDSFEDLDRYYEELEELLVRLGDVYAEVEAMIDANAVEKIDSSATP